MTQGGLELARLGRPLAERVEGTGPTRVQIDVQPVGIRRRGLELERRQRHAEQTCRFFVG